MTGSSAGKSNPLPLPAARDCQADLCSSGDFTFEDDVVTLSDAAAHIEDCPVPDAGSITVRELNPLELEAEFLTRWRQLEASGIEGNAFLSPEFVLAAVEYLPTDTRPFVLAVERKCTRELIGLGVFEETRGSRCLPLTHLQSWQCDYGFTDGLLLHSGAQDAAADALFAWLIENGGRWHGLAFSDRTSGSRLDHTLIAAADRAGLEWIEDWRIERAAIQVAEIPEDCFSELYSKNRRKRLRRDLRRLETRGRVKFRIETDGRDERLLQEFLRLEKSGWKGADDTALASRPDHTQFCRSWVESLAANGKAVFAELTVDGRPIAMSLNLLSGDRLFAFKIGWDPDFADCSPGVLSELLLLQSLSEQLPAARFVDSCARPDSYLESVWPWKLALTTGVFPVTRLGSLAAGSMLRIKQARRLLRR